MTDIVIKSENKEEQKKDDSGDITATLRAADEYKKLKEENDKIEKEISRHHELLKAKIALGGRTEAGQPEESEEEKANKEASEIMSRYGV